MLETITTHGISTVSAKIETPKTLETKGNFAETLAKSNPTTIIEVTSETVETSNAVTIDKTASETIDALDTTTFTKATSAGNILPETT